MQRLILPFLCLLLAVPCKADTIIVDQNGFGDFNNIQEAINYSWNGDTVIVNPGTYYENVYFYGMAVTLTSTNPSNPNIVAQTIINGNQADSVVTFAWGEDGNSVITGFTITNGLAESGGGICCWSTSPTITNCVILGNSSVGSSHDGKGGGIYGCSGIISNCIITGNYAEAFGGGLSDCDGTISSCTISDNSITYSRGGGLDDCDGLIVDCTIRDNYIIGSWAYGGGLSDCDGVISHCRITGNHTAGAGMGGGLYRCDAEITSCDILGNYTGSYIDAVTGGSGGGLTHCNGPIYKCTIVGNVAGDGGGLYRCNGSIRECTIADNSATWSAEGGGLWDCDGEITNCVISGNRAYNLQSDYSNGGGLYHCDGQIKNCIISGNITRFAGGGLYECGGSIENCSITENRADDFGAGIYFGENYSPIIKNNIIAYNEGEGVYWKYAVPAEFSYNNLLGNTGGDYAGWATPGEGDISIDPCFVALGCWNDPCNTPGDTTDDVWFGGNYHLKSETGRWDPNSEAWTNDDVTSLCIDAGDPNSDWTAERWPHGKRINMGAYGGTAEASMSLSDTGNIADLSNDDSVDFVDFTYLADSWEIEEVLLREDLNRDGSVDSFDLGSFVDSWLWEQ